MANPSGTVTFLFTDIEGSTKLAQLHPDAMPTLLTRHHAILRQIIQDHQGYIFDSAGDSLAVAFNTPQDAINAACEAQRQLQTEPWDPAPVRVRMGIHTGPAQLNTPDAPTIYTGYTTLATAQRVMSAGHGGQILLSGSAQALAAKALPPAASLLDLGEHNLKDLLYPEHIYQLNVAGLAKEFPALKTNDVLQTNLPTQLSAFIGREKEVAALISQLGKHRLVTLTGSGGIGKTRLSLQVAEGLRCVYPHGAWLVELAPVTDPALVAQTVCAALGVPQQINIPALETLSGYLRQKKLLLVLDNCEHMIDACARLCERLLQGCPDLAILASSRESLGIEGEYAYRVPSLTMAEPEAGLEAIRESEAVRLFVERAGAVQPGFGLMQANAAAVAKICRRLDGIALAIELAASRVKLLKVEQIAARLDDVFRLLTGGSRTALPRQQTLRALIDWSYNLLSEQEREALQGLSVFMGGWTLEAAEAVCDGLDMLDLLTHLVDKSLVAVDIEHGAEPRYYLLETIRQYAREKLTESGRSDVYRKRHLGYFAGLARRAEPELRGPNQVIWFDRLKEEIDNIRSALEWSLGANTETAHTGIQLASDLWWLWFQHFAQDGLWIEKALQASPASDHPLRHAMAYARLTIVSIFHKNWEIWAENALALGASLGEAGRESVALVTMSKAWRAIYRSENTQALQYFEECLVYYREVQDAWGICECLTWIGMAKINQGSPELAIPPIQEALALARKTGDGNEIGFAIWQLGRSAMYRKDYPAAISLLEESLAIYRKIKLDGGITFLLADLGKVALEKGDFQQSILYQKEALSIFWKLGDAFGIAQALEDLAAAVAHTSKVRHAARLLGTAEALRGSSGAERYPIMADDYEHTLETLHSRLDKTEFDEYWAQGQEMNFGMVVEQTLTENF